MSDLPNTLPHALLLIGPGCPYCQSMLQVLQEPIKQARLAELRIVNIAAQPETAADLGVRSVPWLKLGDFELEGAYSGKEINQWLDRASSAKGMADYFAELLGQGQRDKVLAYLHRYPQHTGALFILAADENGSVDTRVGVASVVEELAEQPGQIKLDEWFDTMLEMTRSSNPTIRADGAFFVSLSGHTQARAQLKAMLEDDHPMVRDMVEDALEDLD